MLDDGSFSPIEADLFNLDLLPPKCSTRRRLGSTSTATSTTVSFRAHRLRRRFLRDREETSEWSGEFDYEGEPIALRWDTFWEV